jgi:uncharacterized phiE125 gp8 family phage protein
MKTTVINAPALEPVSLDQVKVFLKITHAQEDELLQHLIKTVREMAETATQRKFITQRLASVIPFYPNHKKKKGLQRVWRSGERFALFLSRGPLKEVIGVDLISDEGVATPLRSACYHINPNQDPALLVTAEDKGWGLRVTYDAGYGDGVDAVPAPIRQALLNMVARLYSQRTLDSGALLKGVWDLLAPYQMKRGVL